MFVSLLSPLKVKSVMLRNRIVLPPMQTGLATKEGFVTDNSSNTIKNMHPGVA